VFSNQLQAPNAVLVAASPGHGLPQLQSLSFGQAGLGYGDVFAAAVVGGILAAERGPQLAAAVAMVAVSLAWDQLFLVYDTLPATIPPAIVLLLDILRRQPMSWQRRRGLKSRTRNLGIGIQESTAMTTPKVTEIRRPLEAVTPDPFIPTVFAAPRPSAGLRAV
jgi:hypothetical protein